MYINNANQKAQFWKIYKELQRNVSPILTQISPQRSRKSRSFELLSNPFLEISKFKSKKLVSQRIIKSPRILTQFGIPTKRISKVERIDIMEIISQKNIETQQQEQLQQPKGIMRRVTHYEFMSQKQKRLNNLAPHTLVYQHSHEAIIVKKKKINRLKNQYKFLQRSKQRRKNNQFRSKSCPLKKEPKITHKKAQTIFHSFFSGRVLPIDTELYRKIALLCFQKRNSQIIFRRRTCIQESKTILGLSKEKLLLFQQMLHQQLQQKNNANQNQLEISTPLSSVRKINHFNFIEKQQDQKSEKSKLTPRQLNEKISTLIARRSSHVVVEKYIQEKVKRQNYSKSPTNQVIQNSNFQASSPTLSDINSYFLSQKKNEKKEINLQINSIQQSIKKSIVLKQQFFDQNDTQKVKSVEERIHNTNGKKPQQISQQLISACRFRTLPSEHQQQQRKKLYYFQKLKPYYK